MRRLRVVATVALIATFASVAVPVPAGSRVPSSFDRPDPDLFRAVEVAARARGTTMMTSSPDPGARSPGRLDQGSILYEPAQRPELPAVRPAPAQRQPAQDAQVVRRFQWRTDDDVSWYGPGFFGNGTACGQKLTRELVGVAHRTLPCGTLVQFRNPKNGSVVTAPVVDRGPYVRGRSWDLTRALCAELDQCFTGTLQWRYAPGG